MGPKIGTLRATAQTLRVNFQLRPTRLTKSDASFSTLEIVVEALRQFAEGGRVCYNLSVLTGQWLQPRLHLSLQCYNLGAPRGSPRGYH